MLNYEVDASLLLPFLPAGTELDRWSEKVFVSLVGFRFLKTKMFGLLPIPMHSNFEEVNLRFYVRRQAGNEVRRGVVFIREMVPRRAIAFVARSFYNENYVAMPMAHEIRAVGAVSYTHLDVYKRQVQSSGWGRWSRLRFVRAPIDSQAGQWRKLY